jgi:hypothetical protein
LCGCVVVWLCGCVVVWLCGCVVVWLCGGVVVWLCGCVVVSVVLGGRVLHPIESGSDDFTTKKKNTTAQKHTHATDLEF